MTRLSRGGQGSWRATALIVTLAAGVTLLHYSTPPDLIVWHEIYQHLSYVPIVLAAFRFGLSGGVACSLGVSAIYIPHVLMHAAHREMYLGSEWAEIVVYNMVGALIGSLSDAQRRERARTEAAHAQLRLADRLAAIGTIAAGLAHEVRTPLTSMRGVVDILEKRRASGDADDTAGASSEKARELLWILRTQVDRLEALVSSFLAYARPTAPQRISHAPAHILEGVARLLTPEASGRGVSLDVVVGDHLPPIVVDGEQLTQALLNVVLNAVQFTRVGGRVIVRAQVEGPELVIEVEDQGPGVPPDDVPRLFEPFFTRRDGGTGLGLSIAARIVETQGGTLELARNSVEGSTFGLRLPLRSAAGDPSTP